MAGMRGLPEGQPLQFVGLCILYSKSNNQKGVKLSDLKLKITLRREGWLMQQMEWKGPGGDICKSANPEAFTMLFYT